MSNGITSRMHFDRNQQKALLLDLLALVTGENVNLVSFEEVAHRFQVRQQVEKGTHIVPLDKIVGSVGRYRDFTRAFLPRKAVNRERWAKVEEAMYDMIGWSPIDLFQIGNVYFVRDGNHRVSVARANGMDSIEAYVTEIALPVSLTKDDFERDRWIVKAEYADFLSVTGLTSLRPQAELILTEPGRYETILNHIRVHHYLKNQELDRQGDRDGLDWPEAVTSWYDTVYTPMVEAVVGYELLAQFPGRTVADLYLWIADHREELAKRYELGPLSPAAAVVTFAQIHAEQPWSRALQLLKKSLRLIGGDEVPMGMGRQEFLHYKRCYVQFMARSGLDLLRPENQVVLSDADCYDALLDHISVHRFLVNQDLERQGALHRLSWPQAVMSWYDTIYMPVVAQIERQGLRDHFPERSETDLYLLIAKHREELALSFGLAPLGPETAVVTFAEFHSDRPLARTLKALKYGIYRMSGDQKPLGMSEDEYLCARARHDAGEIGVREAQVMS